VSVSSKPETAGLQRFLSAVDEIGTRKKPKHTISSGLSAYLRSAQSLLLAKPEAPTREEAYLPEASKISELCSLLSDALVIARDRGDFLNVWEIAGIRRNELRNASVLAWLLNPRGSHGRGDAILVTLLQQAAATTLDWPLVFGELHKAQVRTEERPIGSDRDRVDIAIDSRDFILFIEVKIGAVEGAQQLARYVEAANAKALALNKDYSLVIYLAPTRPVLAPPSVAWLTWHHVAKAILGNLPPAMPGRILRQFANHISSF
jgi:hypothetical protein